MKHYAVSLAALALAAALAGCASFPLLSQSSRLVESRSPAAAAMDDGVLRFLYAANTNGGGTLLLGMVGAGRHQCLRPSITHLLPSGSPW